MCQNMFSSFPVELGIFNFVAIPDGTTFFLVMAVVSVLIVFVFMVE